MPSAPRYVLSERAAAALRPLLQAGSAYGSRPRPSRNVSSAADKPPRPFAARLAAAEGGGEELLVYLPPRTAEDVSWDGATLAGPDLGTEAEPWVSLGAWSTALTLWLLVVAPGKYGEAGEYYGGSWSLALAAAPPVADEAGRGAFAFQVAAWEGERGLVQHHLGLLALSGDEVDETVDPIANPCGHPLNNDDDVNDAHPFDSPPRPGGGGGAENTSTTDHPLDGEGEGGYTPLCRDDLERGEETQPAA